MRQLVARLSTLSVALASTLTPPLQAQRLEGVRPRPASASVMILGTYHMGGSSDFIQGASDNVLTARRQREVEALVSTLAAFRPTKIMVEVPVARDSALNARYRRYADGRDTLRADEVDQIGFRLAKRLGHARLYAIDYRLDEDIRRVIGWAAQNGDTAFVGLVQQFQKRMQVSNDSLRHLTITEFLRRMNSPEQDAEGQAGYLRMARVGQDTTHVGADVVAGRYARNLKIFASMARATQPGDRVLVIYGAGHGKLLRDFVRESADLALVDTYRYLAPKRPAARRAR